MVGGEVVACVSEERFSRIKNDETYPEKAIESVLKIAGITPDKIDLVSIGGKRFDPISVLCHKISKFTVHDRLKEQTDYWYPKIYEKKEVNYLDVFSNKLDTTQYPGDWSEVIDFLYNGNQDDRLEYFKDFRRKVLYKHLGIDPDKIIFSGHHRSHAYYAYYGCPLKKDKLLIFTADAFGDTMNASVSLGEGGSIRMLANTNDFMVGRLYRYITLILGMKPDEHEYKVMGLAAYAKQKYFEEPLSILKETMVVDGLGFSYKKRPTDLFFYFKKRLDGYRFDSIAGAIQAYVEEILVQWVKNAIKETGANKLVFGGGVGMNIKAMMKIAQLPEVENIFICPSPSDESLAIGAGYVAMHDVLQSKGEDPSKYLKPFKNAYLGPAVDPREIEEVIKSARLDGHIIHENPDPAYIAKLIDDGKIIGRCVGRSEFGARALGNRSILADPRRLESIRIINEKVKSRDFWMPFAPSVIEEAVDEYFVNPKKLQAPYMTIGFESKPKARRDLKAALHQADLTGRPQIVTQDGNPGFYDIISEFGKISGVKGVLNTSFNIHGKPIVQTASEAYEVYKRTSLDAVVFDGFLIERNR